MGTAIFLVVALLAGAWRSCSEVRLGRAGCGGGAGVAFRRRRLGTLAVTETDLSRSLLLAVASVKLQELPETRGALLAVLQKNPAAFRVIRPSRTAVSALAVSPDGRLWHPATPRERSLSRPPDVEARGPRVRLDASVSLQG